MTATGKKKGEKLNSTKLRLEKQFNSGPGHAWITSGREIENYLTPDHLRAALKHAIPGAEATSNFGVYDDCLKLQSKRGKVPLAPKVEVARFIAENYPAMFDVLDLKPQVARIVRFIQESNPKFSLEK